jgi:hypothetical protein
VSQHGPSTDSTRGDNQQSPDRESGPSPGAIARQLEGSLCHKCISKLICRLEAIGRGLG